MRLFSLLAAVLFVFASSSAFAASESPTPTQTPQTLSPILVAVVGTPTAPKTFSPVIKVQGRACSACRSACVEDWKIDCDDTERYCRRQFVRCMRICWEDYCR